MGNTIENSDDLENAVRAFLGAVHHPQAQNASPRIAAIWRENLLKGDGVELHNVPRVMDASQSAAPANNQAPRSDPTVQHDPVAITNIAIHLVCPHHMTVAFGRASVAYIPAGKIASLGSLGQLCIAATARIVLQEQATADLATALVDSRGLGAIAAAAHIVAQHPCQRLKQPAAHDAEMLTLVSRGEDQFRTRLETLITTSLF